MPLVSSIGTAVKNIPVPIVGLPYTTPVLGRLRGRQRAGAAGRHPLGHGQQLHALHVRRQRGAGHLVPVRTATARVWSMFRAQRVRPVLSTVQLYQRASRRRYVGGAWPSPRTGWLTDDNCTNSQPSSVLILRCLLEWSSNDYQRKGMTKKMMMSKSSPV